MRQRPKGRRKSRIEKLEEKYPAEKWGSLEKFAHPKRYKKRLCTFKIHFRNENSAKNFINEYKHLGFKLKFTPKGETVYAYAEFLDDGLLGINLNKLKLNEYR